MVSARKSEDIGDISPDYTPASGVKHTGARPDVEFLSDNDDGSRGGSADWRIKPFKVSYSGSTLQVPSNADAPKGSHTYLSPRFNVKQYNSSQPKFKEKLSSDADRQSSEQLQTDAKGSNHL